MAFERLKRWLGMFFKNQAEDDFQVSAIDAPEMEVLLTRSANIYRGVPHWLRDDDGIRTVNFAKSICSEVARLATLAIGIQIDGSARAEWLQEQIDGIYFSIRRWVEYAGAFGTLFLKPSGMGFDVFTPFDVLLIDCDPDNVDGIIFKDTYTEGDLYYTRLEYHRFIKTPEGEPSPYVITNRAYVSTSADDLGRSISLAETKWADLLEETPGILKASGEELDKPLFGVLRMPAANNIDMSTPLGLPIYSDAIEELKDLDVAYSRNAGEIFDSEKIILADDRLMADAGKKRGRSDVKMPHYVRNVFGSGAEEFYQEINPSLNTAVRLEGINSLLSQIGYKCGFSNGYFVFNESTGMVTATQVEADDRRTIQLIKDVRDKLEDALNGAIYALNVYADLYALAPAGDYEITYDFGDITYNRDEDRGRWWNYVTQGKVPAWMYFVKFEGMSEDDAKAMLAEAETGRVQGLFDEE